MTMLFTHLTGRNGKNTTIFPCQWQSWKQDPKPLEWPALAATQEYEANLVMELWTPGFERKASTSTEFSFFREILHIISHSFWTFTFNVQIHRNHIFLHLAQIFLLLLFFRELGWHLSLAGKFLQWANVQDFRADHEHQHKQAQNLTLLRSAQYAKHVL